jgi:hypothetical protein
MSCERCCKCRFQCQPGKKGHRGEKGDPGERGINGLRESWVTFGGGPPALEIAQYLVLCGNYEDASLSVSAPENNLAGCSHIAVQDSTQVKLSVSIPGGIPGPDVTLTVHVLSADLTTEVQTLDVPILLQTTFFTPAALPLLVQDGQIIRVTITDHRPGEFVNSWSAAVVFLRLF